MMRPRMLTKSVFLVAATIVTMTLRGTSSFVGQTHLGARSVAVATNRLLLRSNRGDTNGDFWDKQKQLVAEMNASSSEKSLREEQMQRFVRRRNFLLGDTVYISILVFSLLWGFSATLFTPISFAFGSICGLAYSYGLSKFVESLGSAGDGDEVEGAGFGQARFAFLFLLVVFIGKYRSLGLQEIPSIMGFFTYQIATLLQGFREIND